MSQLSFLHTNITRLNLQHLPSWRADDIFSEKSIQTSFHSDIPVTQIKDLVIRVNRKVRLEDDKQYKRITVKYDNQGIVIRDTEWGKNIGTKHQTVVNGGEFIVSKIDAQHGAFGLLPTKLHGAIITSNFLAYRIIEDKVIPAFFELFLNTDFVKTIFANKSVGSTGLRSLKIGDFLNLKIPIPSLYEQKILVKKFISVKTKAANKICKAELLKTEAEDYFIEAIKVRKEKEISDFISIISYSHLMRWDMWNVSSVLTTSQYSIEKLEKLTISTLYGAQVKSLRAKSNIRYIRISDINADGTLKRDSFSPIEEVSNKFLLKENDILITRTGGTIGKSFIYKKEYGKAVFADYLIRLRLNEKKINPYFFYFFTKSKLFKEWIKKNKSGIAQQNINSSKLLNMPVILPPLEIQNTIAVICLNAYEQARNLLKNAEQEKGKAKKEFKSAIFSDKNSEQCD